MSSHFNAEEFVLNQADQCVKCGLCLSQCPTYNATFNENESPRGRISLIQAVISKQLPADNKLLQHLDQCLLCQRCERICPSGVQYGRLMDTARQLLKPEIPTPRFKKMGLGLLTNSKRLNSLGTVLRIYRKSRLGTLLKYTPFLRNSKLMELTQFIPSATTYTKLKSYYSAQGNPRGEILLFSGCMGQNADSQTLLNSIKLVTQLGYAVRLPEQQVCCGALHQHSGEAEQAMQLAQKNLQAFDTDKAVAIIYTSSGCGAQLKNYIYLNWPHDDQQRQAQRFVDKIMDISEFLAGTDWEDRLQFTELNKTVVIHQPCSQRNALRLPNYASELLGRIPGLNIINLADNIPCCGAAGDYMLKYPEQAKTLRSNLLETIQSHPVDIITTTNVGCSLFLSAGIQDTPVQLLNPVSLLAQQLVQQLDSELTSTIAS
ncbi:MAG: (Fe-S)-binding protein [Gammaproteobacteria bacterium]|nr:(Fe-S)-binding protein [Gammaproteobacteria bacterium]